MISSDSRVDSFGAHACRERALKRRGAGCPTEPVPDEYLSEPARPPDSVRRGHPPAHKGLSSIVPTWSASRDQTSHDNIGTSA